MAGFGISCIIIALMLLGQGRPLTEVIALILQDLRG